MYINMKDYRLEDLNERDRLVADMMNQQILNIEPYKDDYLMEKDEGLDTVNRLREEIITAFCNDLRTRLESDVDMFVVSSIDSYPEEEKRHTA